MVDTNSSFLVTKISSGCNFEIALRPSAHFVPFHNGVRNYKAGVSLVIHLSLSHLASGIRTAVAKQRCSDGAGGLWLSGSESLVLEPVRGRQKGTLESVHFLNSWRVMSLMQILQ